MVSEVLENKRRLKWQNQNTQEKELLENTQKEQLEIYDIREEIRKSGLDAFEKINTRQLRGKLWEIKVSQTRIMYVIIDVERVAFLHICKKQKGKAEKKEIETALKRAKSENLI